MVCPAKFFLQLKDRVFTDKWLELLLHRLDSFQNTFPRPFRKVVKKKNRKHHSNTLRLIKSETTLSRLKKL